MKKGDIVVCVDNKYPSGRDVIGGLRIGVRYVVDRVCGDRVILQDFTGFNFYQTRFKLVEKKDIPIKKIKL